MSAALTFTLGVQAQAEVSAVEAIAITVSDADRAADFYGRVLDFEKLSDVEVRSDQYDRLLGIFGTRLRIVRMQLGQEQIELYEFLVPRGRAFPSDTRSNDGWFQHIAIVVSDMEAAYQRLRRERVAHASTGPQRLPDWNPAAGGIEAFYFRDPDGHFLELIHFPPGKGDPRWQQSKGLFLGVDHTAIVVSDTERSLSFYRDALGLRVAGSSENYGIEQEHLNHVFGAHLRITALRAPSGPGIELLQYLTPRDGRPYPPDAAPNDLLHWHVVLRTEEVAGAAAAASQAGGAAVTPQKAPPSIQPDEPGKAMMVRDPDGHALLLRSAPQTNPKKVEN